MSDGSAEKSLEAQKKAITQEGYSSLEELVNDLHVTKANLKSAEEARDKFSSNNDEARKIIGTKGSELGQMKIDNEKLTAKVEELEKKLEGKSGTPTPTPTTPTPQKSVDEQLKEVEEKMTVDQKEAATRLLSLVEDDDRATELVENPTERLKFLNDVVSEKAFKKRPTTFFPTKEKSVPQGEDNEVKRLMKKLSNTTMGPSGIMPSSTGRTPVQERQPDPRLR